MFADALRQLPNGSWRLPFHPQDMIESEAQNEGDHWDDWVASHCPALLLYGERSPVVSATQARAMVQRDRKSTRLNSSHPSISYAVFCLKKKKRSDGYGCLHAREAP